MAFKNLATNKMRSFLTMLGIIIGIASVIAIFTIGDSLTLSVSENMQSVGANDVYVAVVPKSDEGSDKSLKDGIRFSSRSSANMEESDYITPEMVHGLVKKYASSISGVNVQYNVGNGSASQGREKAAFSVYGVSAGYFLTNPVNIDDGTFFREDDMDSRRYVALMDSVEAETLYGSSKEAVGQDLTVTIDDKNYTFEIIGTYSQESSQNSSMMSMFSMGRTSLYVPLKTGYAIKHDTESFQYFQLISAVGTDSEKLASDVGDYLNSYYRNNSKYKVNAITLSGMLDMLMKLLDTITLAISIIAGIALLVGGIGVMNIMLVSVTERTREIGTRKALGARNRDIRLQFLSEAMIICLIGGIIGVVLGIIIGILAASAMGYPAEPSVKGIMIALVFSVSIGLFFGYFPANKASRMNPIDALRYE